MCGPCRPPRLKDQGLLCLAMYFFTRGFGHVDAEFKKLSMGLGSAPQRVGQAHGADQPTNFERRLRSAASRSRLPSPEQAKTGTMPPDDSLRVDDHQSIHNARRDPIETGKKEAIEITEGESLRGFSSEHLELVAQRRISASSEARDRNSPMPAHQISFSMSPMGGSIAYLRLCAIGIELR